MPGSVELFKRYKHRVFVESGTFGGTGVSQALDAGYEQVISIELEPGLCANAKATFADKSNVKIVEGDSGAIIGDVIAELNEPVTFWLDGHFSCCGTAKGIDASPIIRELRLIKQHPVKTHTILIDDMRLMGGVMFDYIGIGDICELIWSINLNYKISMETGIDEFQNDVMVAQV